MCDCKLIGYFGSAGQWPRIEFTGNTPEPSKQWNDKFSSVDCTCGHSETCTCNHGTAIVADQCPGSHGHVGCVPGSCHNNYVLINYDCVAQCTCQYGVAATGYLCPVPGQVHCLPGYCNTGYEMD